MMICEKEKCCGCGLCVARCPVDALTMMPDEEGFLYPKLDEGKCIRCGRCAAVCPARKEYRSSAEGQDHKKTYAGYNFIQKNLLRSSSGGAAYALAHSFLCSGGVVFGVRYKDNYQGAEFTAVDSIPQLASLLESKYVESDRKILFSEVEKYLKQGKRTLVIGLPCDIAAVKALVGDHENLYTCKLICRSNTSNKVLVDFLKKTQQDAESSITRVSLRYKEKDIPSFPTRVRIDFDNGHSYIDDFVKTDFGKAFQILTRPSCSECGFKKVSCLADLTIGDFHGAPESAEYYNRNGVSLICEHTDKGAELLAGLKDFGLWEVPYDSAIRYNWMVNTSIPVSPFREEFSYHFIQKGLHGACEELRNNQNAILDGFVRKFSGKSVRVAVWGVGDTTDYLYERLQIESWNVEGVYDSSPLKIGRKYRKWMVQHVDAMIEKQQEIDVVAVMIPSEKEQKLTDFLRERGWKKEILHIGKYKFYRG